MWGFVPTRRAPLVSAIGAKAMFARARPSGTWSTTSYQDGSETRGVYPEPGRRAQTVFATKRSDSGRWPSRAPRNRRM